MLALLVTMSAIVSESWIERKDVGLDLGGIGPRAGAGIGVG